MTHDYETALDYLRQVQDIFDEIAELREPAQELLDLGEAAYRQNDYETALLYLNEAQQAFGEIKHRVEQARLLGQQGATARIYDEFPVVPHYHQRLEQIFREMKFYHGQAMTLLYRGKIAQIQGRDARIRDQAEDFRQAANEFTRHYGQSHAVDRLIGILERVEEQDYQYGIQWVHNNIINLATLIEDLPAKLRAWRWLALAEQQAGNRDAACEAYGKCLALAGASPVFRDHPVVAEWRREYAELGCGDPEDSESS